MAHVLYEVSAQEKVKLLINPISNCAYPGNLTKSEEELHSGTDHLMNQFLIMEFQKDTCYTR